jgi:hypothetical protein
MLCDQPEPITFQPHDVRVRHVEQSCSAFCDGPQSRLEIDWRVGDNTQYLRSRLLLLQRLGKLPGPLVELFLELGCGETATPCSGWRISALDLRRAAAARFHAASRLAGLASHATNAIDVTSGRPFMKPSHDSQG